MNRKMIALILSVLLVIGLLPVSAMAAPTVASGTFGATGDNLKWTLDSSGLLSISGTGAMEENIMPHQIPWSAYGSDIKKAVISSGVTTIGDYAFFYCNALTEVTIPGSISAIGYYAFAWSSNLTSVTIPAGVKVIGDGAFTDCFRLNSVVFQGGAPAIGEAAFSGVTATASYPASAASWTTEMKVNYGGTLTWVSRASNMKFLSTSLSPAGDIGLNFYVQLAPTLVSDANARMVFTIGSKTQTVYLSSALQTTIDNTSCYMFTCKLTAVDMADYVTAQMYSSYGTVGDPRSYSVKAYCDQVFEYVQTNGADANAALTAVVPFLKAMLNYGAAAQIMFTEDEASALANVGLDAADQVLPSGYDVTGFAPVISGTEDGIRVTNACLLLDATTSIRCFFELTGSKTIDDYTFTVNGEPVTPVASDLGYYVEIAGIAAMDLDVPYTTQVGGLAVTYSGLSYVYQVHKNYGTTGELPDLAAALYAYNQAANAYFV